MVRRRKVKSDDQRNGLQRKKPGKERPDNCKYSQPDPESEKVGSRVPRGHELRVDSNLQQDLGDGGQNHADKELKVRMKESRPVQYLNNVLEQDHRAIKRRVRASKHFRSFWGAWRTIPGYEAIHMIRKGQACWSATGAKVCLLHRFVLGLFAATN